MAVKRPAALKSIADAIGFNPAADPEGYARLLGGRYDARTQATRDTADDSLRSRVYGGGDPGDAANAAQSMAGNTIARNQSDAANGPTGFNRSWLPLLESQNFQADINPGQTFKLDTGSMGLPESTDGTGATDVHQRLRAASLRSLAKQGGL